MEFLREVTLANIEDTDSLIRLLARISSPQVAASFVQALKK